MMDLHPYDGQERRFSHEDTDPLQLARGLELVTRLLRLPEPPSLEGLRYDLRFYSGGIGTFDRLHIALPIAAHDVEAIVMRLGFVTPEAAIANASWRDDFEWLVLDEDEPCALHEAVVKFVEKERIHFQPGPDERARVWFESESNVNAWSLLYEQNGTLGFIGYSQG